MDLDNSSQEPDVSLNDILKAVKEQGDINSRLRQDLSQLRQEVQGSTLSVATQVKKFKTESEYKWKYEGNRVQFSLNSELLEDINHTIWALDYSKTDYAREKIGDIKDKIARGINLLKLPTLAKGVGKLSDNIKQTLLLVIPMMRPESIKRRTWLSANASSRVKR
jgi:hypothetical protein